ncbi:MAG TPA: tetratricopeptide repeat protein [Chitinophagaceae bacterium]|nr:tetratricopeptide repeat protein [Chitinophagaceae bacterium]
MRNFLSTLLLCGVLLLLSGRAQAQTPPSPRDTTVAGPQTFAMIMGISKYKYVRPLSYADKDAEMFRDYLKSPAGGRLKDENIFMVLNEQAISAVFWGKGFQWLKAKKLQKGDKLFIYLAGHGDAIDEDQFFYLTYDCNPAGDKNNYLVGGTIQLFNLKKKIAAETAKGVEVFFIMDACRSNELPGGSEGQNFLNAAISEKRAGEIIMLATGAGQESLEDISIGTGHGLFTYYLVDGLSGLADTDGGSGDNKVTLSEIQKYVDKNVPSIAQQRFKRKQDPYFCCTENSEKVVSTVDIEYLKKWLETRRKGPGNSFHGMIRDKRYHAEADSLLLETYQQFYKAIRENKLTGSESAEYFYQQLEQRFPANKYTTDARLTLAVSFINFAQAKINLYLDCRDAASIQRIRAQLGEEEKADETSAGIDRMERVAQQEDFVVGTMLEKAIAIIREDDPDFAETLQGQLYFFKARGYFGKAKKAVDINKAFEYAYTAYARDPKAAYILNTLSALHLDNYRYDSAIYYAKKAIYEAPGWRYPYITLAFSYRTQNKPDSAIKYYRRSIDVDPGNADAWVDLGHYYFSLSRNDSALSLYRKALSLEPGNVYALNNIGWISYNSQQYGEAIDFFSRSIAADPKFINAYNGLGKSYFARQQFDSARIWYEKAFAHYQDKSFVNVYIGNFYRDLKAWDSAKVYYRQAAAIDPQYEEAYNQLGQSSFALKQYDSARYYYRQALIANPYSAFALLNTGLVYKELKQPDSTYSYFQQAIRLEPRNPSLLNNLGVIYGEEKNYDSAKAYFRRALGVRPDYKPASKNLIRIFREQGLTDSITGYLRNSSQYEQGSPAFLHDMGRIWYEQKRYDSARWYVRKALDIEPGNPQVLSSLALSFQGLKRIDSARIYMRKALDLDAENPVIIQRMADLYRQQKKTDSAIFYFRKYMGYRKAIGNGQLYLQTGNFMAEMNLPDSALRYYQLSMDADTRIVQPALNAGVLLMKSESYEEALPYLQQAVKRGPDHFSALYNLGLVYHVLNRYDSAIQYISRAILQEPGRSDTYYQLACTYALAGQKEQAILYLRQALERGYKNKESLLSDPDLEDLKGYKEFQSLIDKYLPDRKLP